MNKTVFLLEDDKAITELVCAALQLSAINCVSFGNCADILNAINSGKKPDLALLDIMLPDGNGLDVLRSVKKILPDLPVIMLSALGAETDKVKGLNAGADDYIAKPFGILEFSARISAALRRSNASVETNISVGNLNVDSLAMTAELEGKSLTLNQKEFKLLEYLALNAGVALSRDKILQNVWGYDLGETRTVDNHIARLRKMGVQIVTVFGSGYKIEK